MSSNSVTNRRSKIAERVTHVAFAYSETEDEGQITEATTLGGSTMNLHGSERTVFWAELSELFGFPMPDPEPACSTICGVIDFIEEACPEWKG